MGSNTNVLKKNGGSGFGKYTYKLALNVIPSMIQTRGVSLLTGYAGMLVEKTITRGRGTGVTGFRAGQYIGAYFAGAELEGSSYMAQAVNQLTEQQVIEPEKFNRVIDEIRKEFNTLTKDRRTAEDMVQKYLQDNYEVINGQITTIPMSYEEAIDATVYSAAVLGSTSGVIEMIDVLNWKNKLLPKNFPKIKLFNNVLQNTSDFMRKIPIINK